MGMEEMMVVLLLLLLDPVVILKGVREKGGIRIVLLNITNNKIIDFDKKAKRIAIYLPEFLRQ